MAAEKNDDQFEKTKGELDTAYRKMVEKLSKILGLKAEQYHAAVKYLEDTSSYEELIQKYPSVFDCLPGLALPGGSYPFSNKLSDISGEFLDEMAEIWEILDHAKSDFKALSILNAAKQLRFAALIASLTDPSGINHYRDEFLEILYQELMTYERDASTGEKIPPRLEILIPRATRERVKSQLENDDEAVQKATWAILDDVHKVMNVQGVHPTMAQGFINKKAEAMSSQASETILQIKQLLKEYQDPRTFFNKLVA